MADLKDFKRSIAVMGSDRTFQLSWECINEEKDAEIERLVKFAHDLAHSVTQDVAALTTHEVRLEFAEVQPALDGSGDIAKHWVAVLASPKFDEQYYMEHNVPMLEGVATQHYIAIGKPDRPYDNYCGAFEVSAKMLYPKLGHYPKQVAMELNRIFRLAISRYRDKIVGHYPEWRTQYLDGIDIYVTDTTTK